MAVGGHAQMNAYVAGPLGVSVSANVDWIGGNGLVLPGHASVIAVAGPVLRWLALGLDSRSFLLAVVGLRAVLPWCASGYSGKRRVSWRSPLGPIVVVPS